MSFGKYHKCTTSSSSYTTFISSTESTATPAIPTSPWTLGLSESYLIEENFKNHFHHQKLNRYADIQMKKKPESSCIKVQAILSLVSFQACITTFSAVCATSSLFNMYVIESLKFGIKQDDVKGSNFSVSLPHQCSTTLSFETNLACYLRNRKHFPCFYRVIETRVEVWENEKRCGNTSCRRVFPQLFRVLPNLHECLYNSIET